MDGIRRYLLSLIAASLLCSIIRRLVETKTKIKGIVNMVCGLFLAITVISPWLQFKIPDVHTALDSYMAEAKDAAQIGEEGAREQMSEIILKEVEAYILEKAYSCGMDVNVNIDLDEQTCAPKSVEIFGEISPYDRVVLNNYITQTFDIPEELVKWN